MKKEKLMAYEILLVVILLLLYFSSDFRGNTFFYFLFFILLLFSGVRYHVGVDFDNYYRWFDAMQYGRESRFEPATVFICHLVSFLGFKIQAIFFIYSVVILSGVFYFIKSLSCDKELSLLIFFSIGIFYLATFNQIRQWAAISLVLVSIVFMLKKRYILAIIMAYVATLFHGSAYIAIFVMPLFFIRMRFWGFLLMVSCLSFIAKELGVLISHTDYVAYTTFLKMKTQTPIVTMVIYIAGLLGIVYKIGYFSRDIKSMDRKIILLCNMNLMSIIWVIAGAFILKLDFISLMRTNMYFEIQSIILIPYIISHISNKKLRLGIKLILVLFCILYYLNLIIRHGSDFNLVPYQVNLNLF